VRTWTSCGARLLSTTLRYAQTRIAAIKAYAATHKIGQGLIGSRPIEDCKEFQAYAEAYGIDVATEEFSEQTSARRIEAMPLDKFIDVFYKPCWVKWAKDPKDRLKGKH
jgi:hypothetical protein